MPDMSLIDTASIQHLLRNPAAPEHFMYQPKYYRQLHSYLKAKTALVDLLVILDGLRQHRLATENRRGCQKFVSALISLMREGKPRVSLEQTILAAITNQTSRLAFAKTLGEVDAAFATDYADIKPLEACAGYIFDILRTLDEQMLNSSTNITKSYLADVRRLMKMQTLKRLKP